MLKLSSCILPVTVAMVVLSTACSQQSGGDNAQPSAPATPAAGAAYNADQAQEFAALPATLMLAYNGDQAAATEMRVPATTTFADDASALAAYESGLAVTTGSSTSELDRTTSTQSWDDYKKQNDYSNYAPQAYSKTSSGYAYAYKKDKVYSVAGWTIYTYVRPGCQPAYCNGNTPISPVSGNAYSNGSSAGYSGGDIDSQLAGYFKTYGVYAVSDAEYYQGNTAMVELGARLFYDTALSGSGGVACASCHLKNQGTTSIYSLPPTGYVIAGQKRGRLGASDVLARNTPSLFNVGHSSFTTMFWDSRVSASSSGVNGFYTPAGSATPAGLANALAAQALFPLVTASEMAGCSAFVSGTQQSLDDSTIWGNLMSKINSRQDYQTMMAAAFPEAGGVYGIQHVANAIAAFEAVTWRSDKSPFDAYLRGNLGALNAQQKAGASYFYGKGQCASCHSGPFQTDHGHHATAIPQFGPGEGDGGSQWADHGLGRVTGNSADNYKFKTPSLRNIAQNGPWGHDGAFTSLRDYVAHYRNPAAALDAWNPAQVILPSGLSLNAVLSSWNDKSERAAIKAANEFHGVDLSDEELNAIVGFLFALSDSSVAQNVNTTITH